MADQNSVTDDLDESIDAAISGSIKMPKGKEGKVFFDPAEHLEDEGEDIKAKSDEQLDVDPEVEKLMKKYGSAEQIAKAYHNLSRQHGKLGQRAKQLEQLSQKLIKETRNGEKSERKEEKPKKFFDEAEADEILKQLEEQPKEGLERLAERIVSRVEKTVAEREAKGREAYVEENNRAVANERARQILHQRAVEESDYAAMKKYGRPDYEVNDDEYSEAFPQIEKEWQFITDNLVVKDGVVTEDHFKKAGKLLYPEREKRSSAPQRAPVRSRRLPMSYDDHSELDTEEVDEFEGMTADEVTRDLFSNPVRAKELARARYQRPGVRNR